MADVRGVWLPKSKKADISFLSSCGTNRRIHHPTANSRLDDPESPVNTSRLVITDVGYSDERDDSTSKQRRLVTCRCLGSGPDGYCAFEEVVAALADRVLVPCVGMVELLVDGEKRGVHDRGSFLTPWAVADAAVECCVR